ncbi:MAG: metal ABC transporter substrate-binding protein [Myxococcota bacterium]
MKTRLTMTKLTTAVLGALALMAAAAPPAAAKLKVVATLSDYGWLAEQIGGDKVETVVLCPPGQDPHFLAPRPSYAVEIGSADALISTGLDLELWLNALLDKAGNNKVSPGQPGFIRAADGVPLLEVPASADRSQGDVHVYGNPHLNTSPMNIRIIAHDIGLGLGRIDPANAATYSANEKRLVAELDSRAFGPELVGILGGETLAKLTLKGKLYSFLAERDYKGSKLIDKLGGWYGKLRPLAGKSLVTYHRNWAYFARDLGLDVATTVEVKPAVAPTAAHVAEVLETIKRKDIHLLLATSYDNDEQVRGVARRGNLQVAAVQLHSGPKGYFALFDSWVAALTAASAAGTP